MASFTLIVTANPFSGSEHQQAQSFALAALIAGHNIQRIFFYQDAVLCANDRINPPQGQASTADAWLAIHKAHGIPLQLCIANSIRRGMVNQQESDRYKLNGATLRDGFELTGLGEMAEAVTLCDRVVEF